MILFFFSVGFLRISPAASPNIQWSPVRPGVTEGRDGTREDHSGDVGVGLDGSDAWSDALKSPWVFWVQRFLVKDL